MFTLLVLTGAVGWLASVVWQLRLAATKGKVLSRNGYVTRGTAAFDGCVVFYWIALVWGTGITIAIVIVALRQTSN